MSLQRESWKPRFERIRAGFYGPYIAVAAPIFALIVALLWIFRYDLYRLYRERIALLPATFIAIVILLFTLILALWIEHATQRRSWLERIEDRAGLHDVAPETFLEQAQSRFPDPLEWIFGPFLRSSLGKSWTADWMDAGFGTKGSRYLIMLGATVWLGIFAGLRIGGPLIGLAFAFILPLIPQQLVKSRANANRRRFGEQIPEALEAIAAGLSAGLSFPQAVEFAAGELPPPIVTAILRLSRRMALGHPVDVALRRMHEDHPEESLSLVVEGIAIQRQFGGDLIAMLSETASLLRERVELDREVRAVTSQGRLSGWVVAGLVPVSAGILLFSNPAYIDVLFDTLIGQVLVVFALLLQLGGWLIISRMVRIRY